MRRLRQLLWLYLVLLLFEGALRKWIVPSLDAPLLIVRDPLVMWIYFEAYRNQCSFKDAFFMPNLVLAVLTTILTVLFGLANPVVIFFGIHTDYLQIPLIFLMPQILNRDDVIAMGRFILYVSVPMAALVLFQFRSDPDSLVNKGAMHTWYGTVRPSGTFSYIAGLVCYYSLVASFVFYSYLEARTYQLWLVIVTTMGLLLVTACSGSRTCIVSVAIIAAVAILCVVMRGKGGTGITIAAALIALSIPVLSTSKVFTDGAEQLQQRFEDAAANGEDAKGFVGRYTGSMLNPLTNAGSAPLFGNGIGSGTNAASGLLRGDREFIGAEDEWGRLFFECGPLFGLLLVIFRVALSLAIAKYAYDAFCQDNVLPILIYAAIGLLDLNGQWGVPTSLGFSIFGSGLTLAACVIPHEEDDDPDDEPDDHADDESDHPTVAGPAARHSPS